MKFYYVYILQSESNPERFYTGFTDNLESRLKAHNQKKYEHTSKFIPWRIKTTIAFTNREKAIEFEKYLKTSSGRAFARKRFGWFPKRNSNRFSRLKNRYPHQIRYIFHQFLGSQLISYLKCLRVWWWQARHYQWILVDWGIDISRKITIIAGL